MRAVCSELDYGEMHFFLSVFLSRINSVVLQLTVKWAFAVATLSLDAAVFPCFISGQDWPEIVSC